MTKENFKTHFLLFEENPWEKSLWFISTKKTHLFFVFLYREPLLLLKKRLSQCFYLLLLPWQPQRVASAFKVYWICPSENMLGAPLQICCCSTHSTQNYWICHMRRAFVIHQLSRVDEDAPLLSSPERLVSEACQKSCMMKIYAISALKLTHQAVSFVRKK